MVTIVVLEFSGMRCQPLRRALGERCPIDEFIFENVCPSNLGKCSARLQR
ncbi:acetyltransferase [Vibrio cholerae]|nr:acetyltransferase [Vibrio cholerae]EGR4159189.1 acetyltransferase [Vibrio cholerae]TXZ71280.1 acetyltransferase [Vibrio cholerae]